MNIIPFPQKSEDQNGAAPDSPHIEAWQGSKTASRQPLPCKRQPPSPKWLIATLTNQIYSDRNRKKNRSDYWF